jgi:lipoyl(octanoyl) transferase
MMHVEWLGNIPYTQAHELMKTRLNQRLNNDIPDTLLLCTHPPVYTVGRQKNAENNVINPGNTPVVSVERGGNVTFHGPGQLVGYPILQLPEHRRDVHAFLRFLEEYWITLLNKWNIQASRDDRNTGVWVDGKKMVAIGISLRRWVSWHGFALNIDVDLEHYERINPCGMSSHLVARLSDYTTQEVSIDLLRQQVESSFFSHWKQWCR